MKPIRLSKSVVGIEEKNALSKVIDAGYLGMGEEVRLFEDEIKAFLNTQKEVLCVSTGTAALHLALQGVGVGVCDEVLVPSLTYVASFQAVSATGAIPIACDVNLSTGFIDLKDTENRISQNSKVIMPIHYAGNSKEMDGVYELANKYKLRVIEDAAHGFGCLRDGLRVGSKGDVICFSFDGIKNITSGEGGAVVTGDPDLANKIKDARLLGVERDTDKRYMHERSWKFDVKAQGWRYHMSNLMAAIGRAQLRKIDEFSLLRKNCALFYKQELLKIKEVTLFDFDYSEIMPHIFPIKVPSSKRDELMSELKSNNIECGIHYFPNHHLTLYSKTYKLNNVDTLYQQLISLPLHCEISQDDQERIVSVINKFFKK